jgi:hypothetical protein
MWCKKLNAELKRKILITTKLPLGTVGEDVYCNI